MVIDSISSSRVKEDANDCTPMGKGDERCRVPGSADGLDQSEEASQALVVLIGEAEPPLSLSESHPHKEPWTGLKTICSGIRNDSKGSLSSTVEIHN